jgi:hypothetical protein
METHTLQVIEIQEVYTLRIDLCEGSSPWTHEHHEFVFSLCVGTDDWMEIGRGSVRLLSTELIGGFGGLLSGMYCVGDSPEATAAFSEFKAGFPEE